MSSYYYQSYTELRPEVTWDQRTGWQRIRVFHGEFNSLANLANQLQQTHEATKNTAAPMEKGLINAHLAQPDTEGYAMLRVFYQTDLLYQWTLTQNLQENSIYVGESAKDFVDSLSGTTVQQSVQYTRVINGIELAWNKGTTFNDLLTIDPAGITAYTPQDSQSMAFFRETYTGLDATQQGYVSDLYTVRMKGIDSYGYIQTVLRKSYQFSDYDFNPDLGGTINRAYSKTAIVNRWGGVSSPIPPSITTNMPENYWQFAGQEINLLNTGKLQITLEWWLCPWYESIIYGPEILT